MVTSQICHIAMLSRNCRQMNTCQSTFKTTDASSRDNIISETVPDIYNTAYTAAYCGMLRRQRRGMARRRGSGVNATVALAHLLITGNNSVARHMRCTECRVVFGTAKTRNICIRAPNKPHRRRTILIVTRGYRGYSLNEMSNLVLNKSSAVAQMGDCLATIDVGRKVGRGCCCSPFRGGAGSPSNTMSPGPRPTPAPSAMVS